MIGRFAGTALTGESGDGARGRRHGHGRLPERGDVLRDGIAQAEASLLHEHHRRDARERLRSATRCGRSCPSPSGARPRRRPCRRPRGGRPGRSRVTSVRGRRPGPRRRSAAFPRAGARRRSVRHADRLGSAAGGASARSRGASASSRVKAASAGGGFIGVLRERAARRGRGILHRSRHARRAVQRIRPMAGHSAIGSRAKPAIRREIQHVTQAVHRRVRRADRDSGSSHLLGHYMLTTSQGETDAERQLLAMMRSQPAGHGPRHDAHDVPTS